MDRRPYEYTGEMLDTAILSLKKIRPRRWAYSARPLTAKEIIEAIKDLERANGEWNYGDANSC